MEEEITGQFITGIVSGITRYLLGVILKNSDEKEKPKNPNGQQKRKVKKKYK
jgi:hypothetical protein